MGACIAAFVCNEMSGRKIHAGTRHFAVLPLSLAVKPLKCEEGAWHDLLPCPDCVKLTENVCSGVLLLCCVIRNLNLVHFYMQYFHEFSQRFLENTFFPVCKLNIS